MTDPTADPVLLGLEIETAWAAQKHHEDLAAALRSELELEVAYRERLTVKAHGFDRLARLLSAEAVEMEDLTDVVKAVKHRHELLSELQNR